jgi:uncharacterized protein YfkK (UPF0435 family)
LLTNSFFKCLFGIQAEEQMMAGTTKKLKMVKEDIVICNDDSDEDKENEETDCF